VDYVAPAIESRTLLTALMTPPASDGGLPSPLWNRSGKSEKGDSATDTAAPNQ
jgi:hypothetical protein